MERIDPIPSVVFSIKKAVSIILILSISEEFLPNSEYIDISAKTLWLLQCFELESYSTDCSPCQSNFS